MTVFLHACAPCSELPSNISTMVNAMGTMFIVLDIGVLQKLWVADSDVDPDSFWCVNPIPDSECGSTSLVADPDIRIRHSANS